MSQTPETETPKMVNGVNVTALSDMIDAVKENVEIAKFQFRARNNWIDGGHNRTMIKEFYGAGAEDTTRKQPFVFDNDEPPVLLGADKGANPVEYILNALAACLTTTVVYHAAARGIKIEAVESSLEGDLDLRGFLGLSDDVRKGYQQIRVAMKIKTGAEPALLKQLANFSPVYDIVSNSVPVEITIETY